MLIPEYGNSELRTFDASSERGEFIEEYAKYNKMADSGEWSGELWAFEGSLIEPPQEIRSLLFKTDETSVVKTS